MWPRGPGLPWTSALRRVRGDREGRAPLSAPGLGDRVSAQGRPLPTAARDSVLRGDFLLLLCAVALGFLALAAAALWGVQGKAPHRFLRLQALESPQRPNWKKVLRAPPPQAPGGEAASSVAVSVNVGEGRARCPCPHPYLRTGVGKGAASPLSGLDPAACSGEGGGRGTRATRD